MNKKKKTATSVQRAFRLAWKNFYREGGLSFVSAFVLMIVITLAVLLFLVGGVADIIINDIEDKADVTVEFQLAVSEERIFEIRDELKEKFELNGIEYTSRDEVKNQFIRRFGDRPAVMDSLEEVGNPFPATLNIKAGDSYTYTQIAKFLEEEHKESVYNVDFYHREEVIAGIFSITESIRRGGLIVSVVLGLVAILLVYNTVKLAIYGLREEIKVMKLVGSSNLFIQSSFIIQGIILGLIASFASFFLVFLTGFLIPQTYNITLEVNLQQYFLEMLPWVVLTQFSLGIILGSVSSFMATRKYLR
jgi:cell division transport system permease protein